MSTVHSLADWINDSLQEELETAPDSDLANDKELVELLLSLMEDIVELVVTLAEEQGREVLVMLEETKSEVARLVMEWSTLARAL